MSNLLQSAESLIRKTYTAPKIDFTPRDIGVRMNDKIDFKVRAMSDIISNKNS